MEAPKTTKGFVYETRMGERGEVGVQKRTMEVREAVEGQHGQVGGTTGTIS